MNVAIPFELLNLSTLFFFFSLLSVEMMFYTFGLISFTPDFFSTLLMTKFLQGDHLPQLFLWLCSLFAAVERVHLSLMVSF